MDVMAMARARIATRIIITDDGCWEWGLKCRPNGYARVTFKRQSWYAHRLSYFAHGGELIEGMDVCHKCDNRKCVNPSHLFQGTRGDNMQDALSKGRVASGLSLPQTKLSENDRELILVRINRGDKYVSIASDYGVSRQTIGRIGLSNGVRKRCRKV
jgi:hypothetical protein